MADLSEESASQRQTRLRREKREKKILGDASSRLDKITSLSSGGSRLGESNIQGTHTSIPPSQAPIFSPSPSTNPATHDAAAASHPQSADPTHAQLEASMRQMLRSTTPPSSPPSSSMHQFQPLQQQQHYQEQAQRQRAQQRQQPQGDESEPQDPMLALLQQLMGAGMPPMAGGGAAQPGGGFEGLPAGLAAMLGGAAGGAGGGGGGGIASMFGMGGSPLSPPPPARSIYLWKILHAIFALVLGIYILYTYTFSGTLVSRLRVLGFNDSVPTEGRLFWIFATAELGLQGGRFLLEGGRSESGMMSTVAGFLPQPWGARVGLASRYMGIWSTLVQDAFVVVFLLGAAAWWSGEGVGV